MEYIANLKKIKKLSQIKKIIVILRNVFFYFQYRAGYLKNGGKMRLWN